MTTPPPFTLDLPEQAPPPPTPIFDTTIVDGSYLINRVLYASGAKGEPPFSEMFTSTGIPTGAVYGCLKVLRSILGLVEFRTNDLIVVWDGRPRGLSPRRMAIYPEYKKREPIQDPKEALEHSEHRSLLEEQRPWLCDVLRHLGVASIDIPHREGDDVIGIATRLLPGKLLVMSDDKDFYQLVSDRVSVYRAGIPKPMLITQDNFKEKIGINTPQQYLLKAAISGDGSDNIHGIKNVGDKTADLVANLARFGSSPSTESIQTAINEAMAADTKGRKRYEKLLEHLHIVGRNVALMDLREESFTPGEEHLFWMQYGIPREVNDRAVIAKFQYWEFKSYLRDISDWLFPFRKLRRSTAA